MKKLFLVFVFLLFYIFISEACVGSGFGVLLRSNQVNFEKIKKSLEYPKNYRSNEDEIQYKSKVNNGIIVTINRRSDHNNRIYYVFSYYYIDPDKSSFFIKNDNHNNIALMELQFLKNSDFIDISESEIKLIAGLFEINGFVYQSKPAAMSLPSLPGSSKYPIKSIPEDTNWSRVPRNITVNVEDDGSLVVAEVRTPCGDDINRDNPVAIFN